MNKIIFLALLGSFLMGDGMSGWNNAADTEALKVEQAEQARMCALYTKKIKEYKETMRDDGLAQATLNNYVRLQTKYCETK